MTRPVGVGRIDVCDRVAESTNPLEADESQFPCDKVVIRSVLARTIFIALQYGCKSDLLRSNCLAESLAYLVHSTQGMTVDPQAPTQGNAEERILALLATPGQELTARQAAAAGRMCERHAKSVLQRLHDQMKVHIKRWISAARAPGGPAASYVGGQGVDAPKPDDAEARIRKMLEHKHELSAVRAAKLGLMSERTAAALLARLCEERFCHVTAWAHERYAAGEPGAIYVIGAGVNVLRPEPLDGSERKRRSVRKRKEAEAAAVVAICERQFAVDADAYAPVRQRQPMDSGSYALPTVEGFQSEGIRDIRRRVRTRKEREGSNNHFDLMHAFYAVGAQA